MDLRTYLKQSKIKFDVASHETKIPVDSLKSYAIGRLRPSLKIRRQLEDWSDGAIHRLNDWGAIQKGPASDARETALEKLASQDPLGFAARLAEFQDDDFGCSIRAIQKQLTFLSLLGDKAMLTGQDAVNMAGWVKTLSDTRKRAKELGEDGEKLARLEVGCLFLPDPFDCPHCGASMTQDEIVEFHIKKGDGDE